ncbi:DNA polymerase III subunit chi [Stutzerimonas tarimensis]|uniref:DNA polymerase III subunit chi n=1 Tax=Stutzerimonas tarimensis TaxID=1507735 RepID=A0ABV7T9Z2_9GAMM
MEDTSPKTRPLLDDLEAIHELLDGHASAVSLIDPDLVPVLCEVVEPSIQDTRLSPQLRTEASLIVRQLIEEFLPQIETELRRRLEVRLDHLSRVRKP